MRYAKVWSLLAIFFILGASGAAAGTILSGFLGGGIAMDVAEPLELEEPWVECLPDGQDVLTSLNLDRNEFRVAAEVQPCDCFLIHLPVINKADTDIKALLTLTYPYGVSLWVTGSGVINDVLPVSYQDWKFTADAGAQGSSASPYDGIRIQVCVSPQFQGSSIEIIGSIQSTSGPGDSFLVLSSLPSEDVLYLHNSASPPTGDRDSQADLPMNMYPPTAATLYNYDKDLNYDPGRTLLHGGAGATELSLDKYQNWQMTVSDELNIHGNLTVVLWSAAKNFDQTQQGTVTAYLRDFNGATYSEIASGTLSLTPWQQGGTSWVERRIIISTDNYTVPAGHTLELKLTAGENSADMWLAYDTVRYPSRLLLRSFPTPDFSASFVSSDGGTVTVAFTDLSFSYEGIVSWLWNFGDGGTSTEQNPQHTYAAEGTYTVSLTVAESDGDTNTAVKTATVSTTSITLTETTPTADFSATPTSGYEPLVVSFTDLSSSGEGVVSWLWDFGDGATSPWQNPSHIYASPGTYTVSLTVTDVNGDSNTKTKTDYITVLALGVPYADFSASPTSGYEPLTVSFTDLSTSSDGIVSWLWDFGDGGTSTEQNPQHTYAAAGTYTVSLTVTDADGDSDTETKTGYIAVLPITTYAIAYRGGDNGGYLKTVDIANNGQITDTVIDTLKFDTSGAKPSIVHISGNIYAIAYQDGLLGYLKTVEVAPNGQITDTVIDTLAFDSTQGLEPNLVQVSGNVYAIAYRGPADDGFLKTVEIAPDGQITATVIDTLVFDPSSGYEPNIIPVSGNVYAIAYRGSGNKGYLKTVDIATNGQITDTVIDTLTFDSTAYTPNIIYASGNIYIMAYQGSANKGNLKTVEVATNGQITDAVIDTLEFDTSSAKPKTIHVSGNIYAITYQRPQGGNDGFLMTVEVTTNGQITDTAIDTLEFDPSSGYEPDIILVSGNVYAIAYRGPDDDGYLKTVEIATNGQITDAVIDTLEFDTTNGWEPSIIHLSK